MAIGARLVYAMARDARFPFDRTFRRVNPRTQTPIPATILIFGGGVVLMVVLPGDALLQLITAGTILPVIIYGATVVLYLTVRKRLAAKEGAFSLGRWELPVAIAALVWLFVALLVLVVPHESRVPVLIVIGLILTGRDLLPVHADVRPNVAGDRANGRERRRSVIRRTVGAPLCAVDTR